MSELIRVLVADDHLIVREGLRLILETEAGFELVGEAAGSPPWPVPWTAARAKRLSGPCWTAAGSC